MLQLGHLSALGGELPALASLAACRSQLPVWQQLTGSCLGPSCSTLQRPLSNAAAGSAPDSTPTQPSPSALPRQASVQKNRSHPPPPARQLSGQPSRTLRPAAQPASLLQPTQEPLDDHSSTVINGRRAKVQPGQTILQAAASAGIVIPSLCYHPRLPTSPGTCRVCLVNVDGIMRPACVTQAKAGQEVQTDTEEVRRHVRGQLAFLRSNHPEDCMVCNVNGRCEFQRLIDQYQVPLMPKTARIQQHAIQLQHLADFPEPTTLRHSNAPAQPSKPTTPPAASAAATPAAPSATAAALAAAPAAAAAAPAAALAAPALVVEGSGHWGEAGAVGGTCAIQVDLDKCIKCGRCVTMCQEVQGMNVLGWVGRGQQRHVGVIEDVELAQSKCIECGQCVLVCPVGALTEAPQWRQVLELLRSGRKTMVVQTAPAVRVAIGEEVGLATGSVSTGQMVAALRRLGFQRVFDTNFSADLTIMEESTELLQRLAYHWTHLPPSPASPNASPAAPAATTPTTAPATPATTAAAPQAGSSGAAPLASGLDGQAAAAQQQQQQQQQEGEEGGGQGHYPGPLPMFTSCCPAWVADVEKRHPELLPHLSSCRSPQAMLGAVIKHVWAHKVGIPPQDVVLVSVMPCTAKKHEAQREELLPSPSSHTTHSVEPHPTLASTPAAHAAHSDNTGSQCAPGSSNTAEDEEVPSGAVLSAACQPDVDFVLTTRELGMMLRHVGVPMASLPEEEYDHPLGSSTGAAALFGATGGVMEAALRSVHALVGAPPMARLEMDAIRGLGGVREAVVPLEGPGVPGGRQEVRVAMASGIAAAEKLLAKIQAGEAHYDFVEVMACPGGCIGGGGQPKTKDPATLKQRLGAIYRIDEAAAVRMSHLNPDVQQLYEEALGQAGGERAHELLHTHYTDKSKDVV